jgi:predicted DNA-binding protein (MmcQ/YjbR family)
MARAHPLLTKLRKLVATLPETEEVETWEHPTFRVRNKIFTSFGQAEDGARIGAKATKPDQAVLITNPAIEKAAYVGQHGWISMHAEELPWPALVDLVEQSYRLIAPKTLVKQLDARDA